MGVGTPQRICELLEDGRFVPCETHALHTDHSPGALSVNHLKRIVIDASHIDVKKRGILDMKELQPPLVRLLNQSALRLRYGKKDTQIIFY